MKDFDAAPRLDAPFGGAKIALLCGDRLVAYRRDRKPGIPYPGLWDLPGGGREGDEGPVACVMREVQEEFGLEIDPAWLCWQRRYERTDPDQAGWFFAAEIGAHEVAAIRFGPEGEEWAMVPFDDFLARTDAVPALQARLAEYLAARGAG